MDVRLEGFHAVKHALRFAPELVGAVTVDDLAATRALCDRLGPDIAEALLARAAVGTVDHPTGVAAVARRPIEDRRVLTQRAQPLVVLDQPRHPGNVGAVVRVAAAAGASAVAVTGTLDPWHPAVLRGSAGLHFALPVLRVDQPTITGPVLVLAPGGGVIRPIPSDAVLVVGSERNGVSRAWLDRAESIVSLPMQAGVSSLNLATATAAALYLWRCGGALGKALLSDSSGLLPDSTGSLSPE